jgi:transcriptional regulator with XRE-family HTH domain
MSDVRRRSRDATSDGPKANIPRVSVDRELFDRACAGKGAYTEEDRAALLGTTAKMVYNYRHGRVQPILDRAREIADVLGVDVDDLWPKRNRLKAAA